MESRFPPDNLPESVRHELVRSENAGNEQPAALVVRMMLLRDLGVIDRVGSSARRSVGSEGDHDVKVVCYPPCSATTALVNSCSAVFNLTVRSCIKTRVASISSFLKIKSFSLIVPMGCL